MNNWWDFEVLGEIFIFLKLLFVWSHLTPHFNQKLQLTRVIILKFIILKTGSALKLLFFCLKCCVWVICVFLVLLLAWGCIIPQINQKNLIIVIILLRSTPLAPEVSKMAYFLEKLTFLLISYLLSHLFYTFHFGCIFQLLVFISLVGQICIPSW